MGSEPTPGYRPPAETNALPGWHFLLLSVLLMTVVLLACSGTNLPGLASGELRVTLRNFQDQRPQADRVVVSLTMTNTASRLMRTRRYQDLSCVLEDASGGAVAYKSCGTPGLMPQESYNQELEFVTLNSSAAARILVVDGSTNQALAHLEVDQPYRVDDKNDNYTQERYRGEPFPSLEAWQLQVGDWLQREPPSPGPLASLEGSQVGLRVSRQLNQLPDIQNDKWKHCVVGGEIARVSSVETAIYAGWVKEYRDLTDGSRGTEFNENDFEATRDGAIQADLAKDRNNQPFPGSPLPDLVCDYCPDLCELRWGNPYAPWNGRFPPG